MTKNQYIHIVSLCQEENSIMNFAVTFLKMLALYVLWRAQFLSEFYGERVLLAPLD